MNVLQFFHKKKEPMFNIGDKVRMRENPMPILKLYNKEYPNCRMSIAQFYEHWHRLQEKIGRGIHIVSEVTEGTPAAGGWFIGVDYKAAMYHGNIFERYDNDAR